VPNLSGADVATLIANEPPRADDDRDAFGRLQRLCRAAARALSASGVGVIVMSEQGDPTAVASSSRPSEEIQELQLTLGEGPGLDAYALRRPSLTPDLALAARSRWLGYGPAARERGVEAVFAFPLQMGAARLGAMNIYRDHPGSLSPECMTQAFSFAQEAMGSLLDAHASDGSNSPAGLDALESRFSLYQAQGMVSVQLRVGLAEAMSRLRAHAYALDRRLGEVADDVVARKLTFESDQS